MEIINATQLPWETEDIEQFQKFLETTAGKRLIPKLAESAPPLLGSGLTNDILIRSGEMRGFQLAIQSLFSLAHSQPAAIVPENHYPPLEDDRFWADGHKLNQP